MVDKLMSKRYINSNNYNKNKNLNVLGYNNSIYNNYMPIKFITLNMYTLRHHTLLLPILPHILLHILLLSFHLLFSHLPFPHFPLIPPHCSQTSCIYTISLPNDPPIITTKQKQIDKQLTRSLSPSYFNSRLKSSSPPFVPRQSLTPSPTPIGTGGSVINHQSVSD